MPLDRGSAEPLALARSAWQDAGRAVSPRPPRTVASAFTHTVAAAALTVCIARPGLPGRVWVAALVSAVLPDLDVIGFRLGVPYQSMLGHRGLTHSIPFAAVWALGLTLLLLRAGTPGVSGARLWTLLFLSTASHGLLDALTDGGGGVAFLAPFTAERFTLPWHPLLVSPLSIRSFFSLRGLLILRSEILWVWLPAAAIVGAVVLVRRRRAANDA